MNWAKENPFLTGFLVVSVLVIGGLGYFAYSQYGTNTELLASYDTEVGKLHSLQNQTPFPNAENLKKAHALVESGTARGKIVLSGF